MKSETGSRPTTVYDLEDRTFLFARDVRIFVGQIPKKLEVLDDLRQLLRASGSVGANYIEANESLSKKDFLLRIKICRKEAKEGAYWLKLLGTVNSIALESERQRLFREASELELIFGSILKKSAI